MSLEVFVVQALLKVTQINVCTPVQEVMNPFMAFAFMGVLQGFVYGQCTRHFSLKLGLIPGETATSSVQDGRAMHAAVITLLRNARGMLRGSLFAGLRDLVSQGVPFTLSGWVCRNVMEPIISSPNVQAARKGMAVLVCSLVATLLSQGFHNLQTLMQSRQDLSYTTAVHEAFASKGIAIIWTGVEARIGLLLLVNLLNELFLKKVWKASEGGIKEEVDEDVKHCRGCGTGTRKATRDKCKKCGLEGEWLNKGEGNFKHSKFSKKLFSRKFSAARFHINANPVAALPLVGHDLERSIK